MKSITPIVNTEIASASLARGRRCGLQNISFLLCLCLFIVNFMLASEAIAQAPHAILYNGSFYPSNIWSYSSDWGVYYTDYGGVIQIEDGGNVHLNYGNDSIATYSSQEYTFSSPDLAAAGMNGAKIRPTPPQYAIVTGLGEAGVTYALIGINFSPGQSSFNEELNYQANNGDMLTIHRNYDGNIGDNFNGDVAGYFLTWNYFTKTFSFNFDPSTIAEAPLIVGDPSISISFPGTVTPPSRQGPPYISWNGTLLTYSSTDAGGKDYYADGSNSAQVIIDNGSSTTGSGPSGNVSGSYDGSTQTFSVNVGNFFAMDDNRSPIGLPTGLVLSFGYSGFGNSVLVASVSSASAFSPNYTYQKPNGTWIAEYVGLAPNRMFLVADNFGNFNSQIYLTADTSAQNQTINAVSSWPATNIYPGQIYLNDVLCAIVSGSQYDSGGGLPRNGGVSYRAAAYDLTVVLSWTWDGQTGFHGYITGKYGQSSSFKGDWNGLDGFTNMTNGAIASLSPMLNAPSNGHPPQVTINGSAFTYDPATSAASGVDVYQGPLGQSVTIAAGNQVVYAGNGFSFNGAYNPTTHQFNFGAGNTVDLGNGNNAVITATDTSGHNLAILNGNTNSGGVTELFGGLDVHGNTFSLGSWASQTGESLYAFGLAYADNPGGLPPSLLGFSTTRSAVNWLWSHPSTDGGSDQITAMLLDHAHRVLLYDPANPANANVVLDPGGASGFHGPVRIRPQGDISMGGYQNGPTPP